MARQDSCHEAQVSPSAGEPVGRCSRRQMHPSTGALVGRCARREVHSSAGACFVGRCTRRQGGPRRAGGLSSGRCNIYIYSRGLKDTASREERFLSPPRASRARASAPSGGRRGLGGGALGSAPHIYISISISVSISISIYIYF